MSALLKVLNKLIWIAVLLVVLAFIGKSLLKDDRIKNIISGATKVFVSNETKELEIGSAAVNKKISGEMAVLLSDSLKKANLSLDKDIDAWKGEFVSRVDSSFLPWYFGYWNQQIIGLKSLGYKALAMVNDGFGSAEEKITEQIQEEFSNRVLRPEIAQMEIEKILTKYAEAYVESVQQGVGKMKVKLQLSEQDWAKYLDSLSKTAQNINGNRETPISLKVLTAGSVGGTVMIASALKGAFAKATGKVAAKVGSKAAAKMAAKTGAKFAGKVAGEFLGSIIGVAY